MAQYLTLKWGTLKAWDFGGNEKAEALLKSYWGDGISMSAAAQNDTPQQKQLICDMIDAVDGEIWNDWDGKVMSKDEAKTYVRDYGKQKTT